MINGYEEMAGLPVYITASNTLGADYVGPPAENYPAGWLTYALDQIEAEPQVMALCWFVDWFPHDAQWDDFSLSLGRGGMGETAVEFDALLQGQRLVEDVP